jgi:hypothetical protein
MTASSLFSLTYKSAIVKCIKITPEEAKLLGWCQDWIPYSDILNTIMGVTEEDKKNSPPFEINQDFDHPLVGDPVFCTGASTIDLEDIKKDFYFGKVIEVTMK